MAVTVSVGVAEKNGSNMPDFSKLMSAADKALYEAKHAGRNRVIRSIQPFELAGLRSFHGADQKIGEAVQDGAVP